MGLIVMAGHTPAERDVTGGIADMGMIVTSELGDVAV
jgi:hypothetical protein